MSDRNYEYARYSTLAGDFADAPTDRPHTVEFVRVVGRDGRRGRSLLLAFATIVFEVIFLVWLLQPSHLPYDDGSYRYWVAMSLVVSIGIIETMRLVNVITLAWPPGRATTRCRWRRNRAPGSPS